VDAPVGLESGFALLFGKLLPGRTGEALTQSDKARLALAELSGTQDRLLVLDNVEDAESVRRWLPSGAKTGCRTLIASRFSDGVAVRADIPSIALGVLEPQPSRRFLLARTGRMAEGAELAACDELAKALGYLPLALEQAAAHIARPGGGAGFAAYLRLYGAAAAGLSARNALGSAEYPDAVITTWQTTVLKLSPESRAVLQLCAWYADAPILRTLVMGGATEILALAERFGPAVALRGRASAESRMRDALAELARYSMILDCTDETFRVHGLVQAVERVRAEKAGHDDEARDLALARLTAVFPSGDSDPSAWPHCRMLLPHLRALVGRLELGRDDAGLARLLDLGGSFLERSRDEAGALPLHRRALAGRERLSGAEHPDTLASANKLAGCMLALGDAAGALPLYRRALEGRERTLGVEHQDTLDSANSLAGCMLALDDAAGALPLHRRALEGRERMLGAEHQDTLDSANSLAGCMVALGDAAGALPLYRRALEGRERTLGAEHPDTLASANNSAGCVRALGDAAGALPLYRQALEGRERLLGAEHPDTLASVHDLARCTLAVGDAAKASVLYRRALKGRERLFGAEHPDTLASLHDRAYCLHVLGDSAKALLLYRRALEGRERVLGAEHPRTLASLNNVADCLFALGDFAGALPIYSRTLERSERALGAAPPRTLHSLAICMELLGDAAGALPLFRRALENRERVRGAEHRETLDIVGNLAGCLMGLHRLDEAAPLRRRQVDDMERRLGADHPDVLTACSRLAASMRRAGRPDLALPYARRVMQ
jgi:tetratricopeptide (TPR) repeat protein